ncbi:MULTISPECIES: hypothetical protein [unclassified Luteimonas]|uniref:hypothetical protein n=1 Tax=unclassified Luteimonas TaxID=2629088 RepID=UPI0018F06DAB|nr:MULTISPECIES: hypothetical protein [unclassified Luteimonas]MBJ6978608.1 hypothetical protein [Luteimonas sp. MC1895]MBJ6983505.1 hypothetical protein [Luteimonas sp. MC1750]QQO06353.1 hypothetical protein JGR68_02600 [Luteimonas sp. MC1750]
MLFSLLALLLPATASATINSGDQAFKPDKGLDLNASFNEQRAAINKALGDGETYVEISADDVRVVQDSLGRISTLLAGAQSINQMSPEAKVELFNEQERVNTLLVRAHKDSRLVCRREKPTGSHRPTTLCLTVAERRRHREAASDFFRYNPRAQGPVSDP